jgi:hypothetical protein
MIQNLGNIGDFIGGVGVVVTLIYLATQIRQNTRSLRLSSIQQIMGTSVAVNETSSTGPVPGILAKLEMGQQLTPEEFATFIIHTYALLTHQWQVYYQYQHGMIDESVFDAYVARLKVIMNTSLSRSLWHTRIKSSFPDDFQDFVNKYVDADG